MTKEVIPYDKDLPEIPGRAASTRPSSYLRKKRGTKEFEIVDGRRPTERLLVTKLRKAVDQWRKGEYKGASPLIKRLFSCWFEEEHLVGNRVFNYYFGQREAIETLVYLTEIWPGQDTQELIREFGSVIGTGQQRLPGTDIVFQTTMDGKRQVRRYIPEIEKEATQDLPLENLRRYAFKMATGSGKTAVMAMVVVWLYFRRRVANEPSLSDNFLIVAPNVIVYQRLQKDFADNKIFNELPLIPPELKPHWQLKTTLRGEDSGITSQSGNLFVTNIQQLYESRAEDWTPQNEVDAILGRKPVTGRSFDTGRLIDRIKSVKDLTVINDEAHHVHDEDLLWNRTLISIHQSIPRGISLWLDFSATPKDQQGTYFPWIICDYPLAQAIEDKIVKALIIGQYVRRKDPEEVTAENVIESYEAWLQAALLRWQEHCRVYEKLGLKPILFIMAEKSVLADKIGKWLVDSRDTKLRASEVLVIHTDTTGEITKSDLEKARTVARDIDRPDNKVKVIVSVLMLREGWDVKNVTVVLGLRPFTSRARILPEQAIGRGLRLMEGVSPDSNQTLEVMGTEAFEEFVQQLEVEGVGIKVVTEPPADPVIVYPVEEKIDYDIVIPLPHPVFTHNYSRLSELDPQLLSPIYDQEELKKDKRNAILELKFATTDTPIHEVDVTVGGMKDAQDLLRSITNRVLKSARLAGPDHFALLYPKVRDYVRGRCFGLEVDLTNKNVISHLRDSELQDGIARYLARAIGELTVEQRSIEFENEEFRLSHTTPFSWRRNLPPLECEKTIFNFVATYNNYEREFAEFLDQCPDVARFASLGTTEQESGSHFRVDYLKPNGAIGFYHPDWVVVQQTEEGPTNWIVETKGRLWESTPAKDDAITYWCHELSKQTTIPWRYLRVDQSKFDRVNQKSFKDLPGAL